MHIHPVKNVFFNYFSLLADEAAATQSEPEADGAELTQDANNSIANASSSEPAEPPKTEEQAAQAVAQDSASTNTATPEGSSATSTVADAARSAARSASHAASGAASTVAETASTAGQSLGQAAGFGNSPASGDPSTTVYVGNLFFDVRSDDLKKEFERAGSVKEARIISDQRGLSKGFGYVEFDTVESATKAISLYNLQNFEGRRLSVQYSVNRQHQPRGAAAGSTQRNQAPLHSPTKTLFIGNMSFDMSDRDLNNLFREVKNVIDVRVAIDRRTGQPRGFAHADFTDIESAERALDELRGKMVCGRALRVDFSTSTGRSAMGGARAS
ncbi:MAG: hypothetical protein Q9164_001820 [Protoblastenia rupestris]